MTLRPARTLARLAAAAAVFAAACAVTPLAGDYESVLPAANGGGRRYVRVTLKPDGFAAVSVAFSSRPSRFLAEGTWTREDRRVILDLSGARSQRMVFRHAGRDLLPLEWDRTLWGEAGPGVLTSVRP